MDKIFIFYVQQSLLKRFFNNFLYIKRHADQRHICKFFYVTDEANQSLISMLFVVCRRLLIDLKVNFFVCVTSLNYFAKYFNWLAIVFSISKENYFCNTVTVKNCRFLRLSTDKIHLLMLNSSHKFALRLIARILIALSSIMQQT